MKRMRVTVNGKVYDVEVEVVEDSDEVGYGFPRTHAPERAEPASTARTAMGKPVERRPEPKSKELASPIAGMVTEIKVSVGDTVEENQLLMNIEAMKMNTHICSPVAGKIGSIEVSEKDGVKQGQVLLTFA